MAENQDSGSRPDKDLQNKNAGKQTGHQSGGQQQKGTEGQSGNQHGGAGQAGARKDDQLRQHGHRDENKENK